MEVVLANLAIQFFFRVLNHNSSTPVHLEIRVIHSLWPIMSAVQILAPTGECVASSHLIGLESLPLRKYGARTYVRPEI